jgi:hypothetical protein
VLDDVVLVVVVGSAEGKRMALEIKEKKQQVITQKLKRQHSKLQSFSSSRKKQRFNRPLNQQRMIQRI